MGNMASRWWHIGMTVILVIVLAVNVVHFGRTYSRSRSMNDPGGLPSGAVAPDIQGINLNTGGEASLNGLSHERVILMISSNSCSVCVDSYSELEDVRAGDESLDAMVVLQDDIETTSPLDHPGLLFVRMPPESYNTYHSQALPVFYLLERQGASYVVINRVSGYPEGRLGAMLRR